jgi:diaminohydroxyphosphoribosylaminopyrimidine deaminase / 5-amino-6-(5-phosphoribosylamino)uracil reductase
MTPHNMLQSSLHPWDERFMRMAIELGNRNHGRTWPNPSVGAVFVDESHNEPIVLATGITQPSGRPHAERVALAKIGEKAKGSTVYVSLEPCAHHGKTSPCCDALIEAGVARVVTSLTDPDVRVAGQGHQRLREAGIEVITDVLRDEGIRAHRGHILRVTHNRPAVILKLAMTADGYAATQDCKPLAISSLLAMAHVHMMRAKADAILIGSGTLASDDPQLTVRLPDMKAYSPVRVVLDSALSIKSEARLLTTSAQTPTWIFYHDTDVATQRATDLKNRYPDVIFFPIARSINSSSLDLKRVLNLLAEKGITRVFSEGGPRLAQALAQSHFIDEFILSTSSTSLKTMGYPAILPDLEHYLAHHMHCLKSQAIGSDTFTFYERN